MAKLIAKGDKARALATYNALAIGQGFYGGSAISMDEFERQIQAGEFDFKDLQNQPVSPEEEKLNELKYNLDNKMPDLTLDDIKLLRQDGEITDQQIVDRLAKEKPLAAELVKSGMQPKDVLDNLLGVP